MRAATILLAGIALLGCVVAVPAFAQVGGLGSPVDSSLSAETPGNGWLPSATSGFVSTSFGSNGMQSNAIGVARPISANTSVSLMASEGQSGRWRGIPQVDQKAVAVGVQTRLPDGSLLGLQVGTVQDRLRGSGMPVFP